MNTIPRIFYWRTDTDLCPIETGIQRVVRHLARALRETGSELVDIRWDSSRRLATLCSPADGSWHVDLSAFDNHPAGNGWLLIPEIPLAALGDQTDPVQIGKSLGLRTAMIVHDVIPVRFSIDYTALACELFTEYYRMCSRADIIFVTTEYVASDLRQYLQDCQLDTPDIVVVPLPAELAMSERRTSKKLLFDGSELKLLTVSTWEPRKNHPLLLRALRRAQARSECKVSLTIAGWHGTFPEYIREVEALVGQVPNVTIMDWVDDQTLFELYDQHHASVYPSREEGFGMPVMESLWMGTPCLCHVGSSMAEIAPGGGTMQVNVLDEEDLASAICRLAEEDKLLNSLSIEAAGRALTDWSDYARSLANALSGFRRIKSPVLVSTPSSIFEDTTRLMTLSRALAA